jgi:hypothetical protein
MFTTKSCPAMNQIQQLFSYQTVASPPCHHTVQNRSQRPGGCSAKKCCSFPPLRTLPLWLAVQCPQVQKVWILLCGLHTDKIRGKSTRSSLLLTVQFFQRFQFFYERLVLIFMNSYSILETFHILFFFPSALPCSFSETHTQKASRIN